MTVSDLLMLSLDGKGRATAFVQDAALAPEPLRHVGGFEWVHIHRDNDKAPSLLEDCGLDSFVIDALTAETTGPRCTPHGHGILLNLRGIDLNPGADPEDMVSIRLWLEEHRVISVWVRPVEAIEDMIAAIDRGEGPTSPGDFAARLALRLSARAEPAVALLNDQIDDLEDAAWDPTMDVMRSELSSIRRRTIMLRRYFLPQRDALRVLEIEDAKWLKARDRGRLREASEMVNRFGEELDAIRDRAQIVHDQFMDKRAEGMNQRMLVLSVVTAIFLPLGLLTGLLGINVGGIPGAQNGYAFAIVSGLLLVIGLALLYWFKRRGMLD